MTTASGRATRSLRSPGAPVPARSPVPAGSRVVVAAVPVQPGADVTRRVEGAAAQRARRPAALDGDGATGGHGPGLGGGEVEAGEVAVLLVAGQRRRGLVLDVVVLDVFLVVVAEGPLVELEDDKLA